MLENIVEGGTRRALRGFVRDGAIVFAALSLLNLLGYVIHFILSRKLGVADYGGFASIVGALAIFGIPGATVTMVVVKFVAEFHALDERGRIRALSLRALTGCGVFSVLILIPAILFRAAIAEYLNIATSADVVAGAFALASGLLLPALRAVLQGTQDFVAFALSILIEAAARVGLAVALVYAGFGVAGAFAGFAAASLLSLGYTAVAARSHWSRVRSPFVIDLRRLITTMGGAVAGTAAVTFMAYIDVSLVKHFFGAADAGLYSAASFCGKILFFVVGFVPLLVLPKAAERAALGKPTRPILVQGIALTAALAGIGLAFFWLVPQLAIRVMYGSAFTGAAPYLFEYGAAMSLLGTTGVVVTYKVAVHNFTFVWPLVVIAIAEPSAIALFHGSLTTVINVLLAANAAALIACLAGWSRGRSKAAVAASADSETAPDYTASGTSAGSGARRRLVDQPSDTPSW